MKTTLPQSITTVWQAKRLLIDLYRNGEVFHPEDDAHDIIWDLPEGQKPTGQECDQLNKLMEDIYNLNGNNGNHANPKFDPCALLMDLQMPLFPSDCEGVEYYHCVHCGEPHYENEEMYVPHLKHQGKEGVLIVVLELT